MDKDVKRMHFAKLVDGECVEFKPEVECSDDSSAYLAPLGTTKQAISLAVL